MQFFLTLSLVLFSSLFVLANEYETTISDVNFSSSSKVVIDEKQIKESKAPNISSLLQSQANISMSSSGYLPNSIYLRGGDPSHTLFILDGVPFYDASTAQRVVDLSSIDIKSVRKIEVIKGSQSVLYGGKALTGIVKIETFPDKISNKTSAQFQGGSNNLKNVSASHLNGLSDHSAFLIRGNYHSKNSKSPVPNSDYRYQHLNKNADLGYIYREDSEYIFKVSSSSQSIEMPGSDPNYTTFAPRDTVDFRGVTDLLGFTGIYRDLTNPYLPRLSIGYLNADRTYTQPVNSSNAIEARDLYGSQALHLRADMRLINWTKFHLDIGANYTKESFTWRRFTTEYANAFHELRGIYVKIDSDLTEEINLSAGLRSDFISHLDRNDSYQVGLNINDQHKFEISTGFKAPSLSELYGYNGNSDLKPEKSFTASFTEEQEITSSQRASLTLFHTEFKDLIMTAGSPRKNMNVAKTVTKGVEVSYSAHLDSQTKLQLSLGYQEPYDVTSARWLTRRPLQTGSAKLTKYFENQNINIEAFGNGEKLDQYNSTRIVSLDSYVAWNTTYNLVINENISTFVRVNNLFNKKYEESYGYQNEGLSALAGIEIYN